ncbi:Actin- protein 6 [Kickxella alabastrina]|uniref:Actin- protein 6 n=1 Tax=Kickxella alabastrina TaxID=61397 RepID=A0ACC1I4W7_9FUNG|nr:Actin- protein 6 [Kickxella alabastrina]
MRTLILDNGSYTIKAGYADAQAPQHFPNTITRTRRTKRIQVGDLSTHTNDLSGLYFRSPFDRGHLVHWDVQLPIWDRLLSNDCLQCTPAMTQLVMTEPMFNFSRCQKQTDEIIFEEYGFASFARMPAPTLCAAAAAGEQVDGCVLVVDLGHTCSYVVPVCNGVVVRGAVRRVDIGGRMLTNYLKETVSFRHWDMMDESFIVDSVKRKTCYVALDFHNRLATTRPQQPLRYVLPDFTHSKQGFIHGDDPEALALMDNPQVLPLGNERFAIPEALFFPQDVGLDDQGGVHLAIMQAAEACGEDLRGLMLGNIVLVGGTARLDGLRERVEREVRALALVEDRVAVTVGCAGSDDPAECAWWGGAREMNDSGRFVKKELYEEWGPDRTLQYFDKLV